LTTVAVLITESILAPDVVWSGDLLPIVMTALSGISLMLHK